MRPQSAAWLAALAVCAQTAAQEPYHFLPRADGELAVQAFVECLDAENGCEVGETCLPRGMDWTREYGQWHFGTLTPLAQGETLRTPWRDRKGWKCAVRVTGRANVLAVLEHRRSNYLETWEPVSRETRRVHTAGSAVGHPLHPLDIGPAEREYPYQVAPGWGDCRPATVGSPCPDSRHIRRRCKDSVGYAVVFGGHGIPTSGVPADVVQGHTVRLQAWLIDVPGRALNGNSTEWRTKHGSIESIQHDGISTYRAPSVEDATEDVVTATVFYGNVPKRCATTSVEFSIVAEEPED